MIILKEYLKGYFKGYFTSAYFYKFLDWCEVIEKLHYQVNILVGYGHVPVNPKLGRQKRKIVHLKLNQTVMWDPIWGMGIKIIFFKKA